MSEQLRIVHGSPTTEELAAVTAIVTAAAGAPREAAPTERSSAGRWNDPAFAHRRHLTVGPGGWRAAR